MVNEFEKMSNLNTFHLRRYVDHWKKTEWQTRTKIWIPLQSWWFPSRKHWTSSVMVRFMKGVHDDINQTFSAFYQGTVRPCSGTMPGVMFFKHLFHFFSSWKPNKQTFVVDYCHTFPRNICPFLVKGMRIYDMARGWFSRPFLCIFSCTDCTNLNYVHN